MNALSFDLELDDDKILCASTYLYSNNFIYVPQLFVTQKENGFTYLSDLSIDSLIESLWIAHSFGTTILTWGGTGSDWPKLLKAAPRHEAKIREMALQSVDIPLICAASTGMMMGLSATADGMNMGSRPNCESDQVPIFWKSNDPIKQFEVIQHVQWDAWACLQIWLKMMYQIQQIRPMIYWITKKNGRRSLRLKRQKSVDNKWELPRVKNVIEWETPVTVFDIPKHLEAKSMTQWLHSKSEVE